MGNGGVWNYVRWFLGLVFVNLLPEERFPGCLVVVSFSVLVVFRLLCFELVLD